MAKHKLAFLISHPTQYHSPLFRELSKNPGIDLTVYFCSRMGLGEHFDKTYERVLKWDTPVLEGYKYVFLKKSFGLQTQIFSELKKNKYDALIVHGYNTLTYWLAFWSAWFTRTPLILKGEADLLKEVSEVKQFFKKIVLNFLFGRVDAFLYSYTLNKEFFKFYGAPEEKLFFCPSAVDNNFFRAEREKLRGQKEKIKAELSIKNKDLPIILFVGQFIQRKRVKDILEAAKILKNRVDFNVLLVGEGKEKENLIKFVRENGLEENVYFLGFKNQSELPKIYSIADVFVLPSEYDPSPKVLSEGLNFELPMRVSRGVKIAPDLILEDGIYHTGDIKELADGIEKLLTNEESYEKASKHALEISSKWNLAEDVNGIIKALKYVKS